VERGWGGAQLTTSLVAAIREISVTVANVYSVL